MRVLHLFAGAGGSHIAGGILGWTSAGSVEIEPFCQAVIRQHYPSEAIHDDVTTFDARHLRGSCDGICGGFPCQDISAAGRGKGITGERSGHWKHFARIIGEARPRWAFIENSPLLRTRGLEVVLEDLAALGYDAEWATFRASDVGAPHRRDRMWILAFRSTCGGEASGRLPDAEQDGLRQFRGENDRPATEAREGFLYPGKLGPAPANVPDAASLGLEVDQPGQAGHEQPALAGGGRSPRWWAVEPELGRVAHGVADRVHRLAALGNGWVPLQAAEAFRQLYARAGLVDVAEDWLS